MKKMKERRKLNEILTLDVGLFRHMDNPVWLNRYEPFDMDLEFITSYGEKLASPLVEYFAKDCELTEDSVKKLANMIYRKYKENWERKYAILDIQYEIIDNYNMKETETLDRDTLEKSIRELVTKNKESTQQLNDLMEILTNDLTNTNTKTGSDKVKGNVNDTSTINQTEATNGSNVGTSTETLSFIDRKDTETRNLSKNGSNINTINGSKTDELSFIDRKDTTSGREKVDGTDHDIGTSSGTDKTNSTRNGKDSVFAFNSAYSNPATENNNTEEMTNAKNMNTENTKTINTETVTSGDLTKTGTERHTLKDNTTEDLKTSETESGTVTSGKTGQEKNVRSDDFTTSDNKSINGTNTSKGETSSETTYNTTDTTTNKGTSKTANTGTVDTKVEGSEDTSESGNITGSVNETRTVERRGNIGVTTTTQLLQEHLNFWKYNFLEDVYNDVAGMLTLNIW